jgi:hypothetical protein
MGVFSFQRNPEKNVHDVLFVLGLFVEGIAIGLAFYNVDINGNRIYDTFHWVVICCLLLALWALLTHQFYIRNSIIDVNHYASNPEGVKPHWISPSVLDFKTEFYVRFFLFVLLAAISGEIPYIIMVVTEKMHYEEFRKNSSIVFMYCCFFLSVTVFVWDVCLVIPEVRGRVLMGNQELSHWSRLFNAIFDISTEDTLKNAIKKSVIFVFILSDLLSSLLWLFILLFINTKEPYWVMFIAIVAVMYWMIIIVVRRFVLGSNPVRHEY